MCGKNDQGQLGLGNYTNELVPYYVTRIPDKVSEVACGEAHTLVVTSIGQLFTMGLNSTGQLGIGKASFNGNPLPTFLEELAFTRIIKVRAGQFSAAMSSEG